MEPQSPRTSSQVGKKKQVFYSHKAVMRAMKEWGTTIDTNGDPFFREGSHMAGSVPTSEVSQLKLL